ncbi:hypothetical protein BKA93DRAFT_565589 [Sparassis latifolia]
MSTLQKQCVRCNKSHNSPRAFLLDCCKCQRSWHHSCHIPPVTEQDILRRIEADENQKWTDGLGAWQCRRCSKKPTGANVESTSEGTTKEKLVHIKSTQSLPSNALMVTNALTHQVPSSTDKRSAPGRPVGDVHSRVDSPVDLTEPQAAPLGSGNPQDAQPSASVEVKSKHSQSRIGSTYSPIADPPPGSLRISIKQLSSNAGSQNRMPKDGTSVPISYTDKNKNTECLTQSVSPVALCPPSSFSTCVDAISAKSSRVTVADRNSPPLSPGTQATRTPNLYAHGTDSRALGKPVPLVARGSSGTALVGPFPQTLQKETATGASSGGLSAVEQDFVDMHVDTHDIDDMYGPVAPQYTNSTAAASSHVPELPMGSVDRPSDINARTTVLKNGAAQVPPELAFSWQMQRYSDANKGQRDDLDHLLAKWQQRLRICDQNTKGANHVRYKSHANFLTRKERCKKDRAALTFTIQDWIRNDGRA